MEADLLAIGLHRRDIGTERLSWHELRVLIEHSSRESAVFRARNPKSWPWSVDTDLLAGILFTLQGANWQRSGGRGEKPKPMERPKDRANAPTAARAVPDGDVTVGDQSSALDDMIARRRKQRDQPGKRIGVRVG